MPWRERSVQSERDEFVRLASSAGANRRALCREFGVSAQTGYRWLRRAARGEPLADRSRRPHHSPLLTTTEQEQLVLELRAAHPTWGGRKLARRLRDLGHESVPAPSTITAILRRHGLLDGARAGQPRAFVRFEHERPNALWQMDFKGHVPCGPGRCHPLTVLDDHSRYSVVLAACGDERTATVRERLTGAFRELGLPERIAVDNGSPWGDREDSHYTPLGVWLLRLGVAVSHSRPYHPQTLGKDERFHRTLKSEVLSQPLADLASSQRRFDAWRRVYNWERPHEALGGDVPAARYTPSPRPYPEQLPALEYAPDDLVRKVQDKGATSLLGRIVTLPRAFRGHPVGFRPTSDDGRYGVYFGSVQIAEVDLRVASDHPACVTYVSEHPSRISPV